MKRASFVDAQPIPPDAAREFLKKILSGDVVIPLTITIRFGPSTGESPSVLTAHAVMPKQHAGKLETEILRVLSEIDCPAKRTKLARLLNKRAAGAQYLRKKLSQLVKAGSVELLKCSGSSF